MSIELWPIPVNWEWKTAGEIADIVGGGTPDTNDESNFSGTIPWITPADLTNFDGVYISRGRRNLSEKGLANSSARILPKGTVLFSSRAPIGYCAIASNPISTNQGFKSLVLKNGILPEFIRYYLISSRAYAESIASGTTFRELSGSRMKQFPIPLPPIEEQRRIVARLDSLLAQSKAARAELNKALALAKRQRQAVLAKAFSGELTQDWRDKQLFPSQTLAFTRDGIDGRVSEFNELPSHWSWTSINEVFVISGGLTKNSKRNNLPIRVPYLRVANVYANELRLSEIENIGCTETELTKTVLQKGDLLIVEGNGSIDQLGRVALWNNEIDRCSHQNHLIRARPTSIVLPKYGLFWLLSPEGRNYIEKVGSSSSGLHTLSISKVGGLPIPMCSLEEQKEIVKRIEAAFAQIETMENEAKKALALAERLEQATLAKAFQGQL